jgi:membrane dipeptidase
MHKFMYTLLFSVLLLSCQETPSSSSPSSPQADLQGHAEALAQRFIIVDGQVDLPYRMRVHNFRLEREYLDPAGSNPDADFDFPRARQGGLDGPFMSIYFPSRPQAIPGRSRQVADSLIDMVEGLAKQYPKQVRLAQSPANIRAAVAAGQLALPMGMENGSGLEDQLSNVEHFHQRGIRYITLTHAKDNLICDSSYDTTRTWRGLSPYGEKVVREMNRVGSMVDISHVSDDAFWDVMDLTEVAMIASHSSCRVFTPGFERNMNDSMIRALAAKEGVIMINFGSTFVDSASRARREMMGRDYQAFLQKQELSSSDSLRDVFYAAQNARYPEFFADVQRVADHIDHVAQLVGIKHLGVGSDFDGVGDSLPRDLKDVSQYPNLIRELLKRGYTDAQIQMICYQNLFRVWEAVEAAAQG